jgi:hypothetical protein
LGQLPVISYWLSGQSIGTFELPAVTAMGALGAVEWKR